MTHQNVSKHLAYYHGKINTGPCFSYAFSRNSAGLFSSAMTCSRNGTGEMSGGLFALAGS